MKPVQWEYMKVKTCDLVALDTSLDSLGRQGWEAFAVCVMTVTGFANSVGPEVVVCWLKRPRRAA